jgi:hypothetical protein
MWPLTYTNLRYDYGYQISEYFRQNPHHCNWDIGKRPNAISLAYSADQIVRELRQNDSERFNASGQALFAQNGIWPPQAGNPELVNFHANQVKGVMQKYGFKGARYDDVYDYDIPAVDIFGRTLPYSGFDNTTIINTIRQTMQQVDGNALYGHNMEFAQHDNQGATVPMAPTAVPHRGDQYSEFLGNDGLHLQERYVTQWGVGQNWQSCLNILTLLGANARKYGGHAYPMIHVSAFSSQADARAMLAAILASRCHLASNVQDTLIGYMRLACRYSKLIYGDACLDTPNILTVTSSQSLQWQKYVRRKYLSGTRSAFHVHLINLPNNTVLAAANTPAPSTTATLTWTLPSGVTVTQAKLITADNTGSVEKNYASTQWANAVTVGIGLEPTESTLSFTQTGTTVTLTAPVAVWSLVVLDCTHANETVPSAWPFTLAGSSNSVGSPAYGSTFSPNASTNFIADSTSTLWQQTIKYPVIADSGAIGGIGSGTAIQWLGSSIPWEANPTVNIQGGPAYTYSVRVKATGTVPNGAT